MADLFGGIEAGGTKFNCIVASNPDNIIAETRFPTTTPTETIGQVVNFFRINMNLPVGWSCGGKINIIE